MYIELLLYTHGARIPAWGQMGRPLAHREGGQVEAVMAKKTPGKRPGPKPDPDRVRSAVTNIRSSPEWKEWLGRFAEHHRSPSLADLVDDAVVHFARHVGFKEVPPKR